MSVKRITLETNEDVTFPVGEQVQVTIQGNRPVFCKIITIQEDDGEDGLTTKNMIWFTSQHDKELNEEPDLYSVKNLKESV